MLKAVKIPRLRVRSARVEEKDWRGFLALTVTIGYVVLLALQVPGVEVLGVAVGLIIGWYFGERRSQPLRRLKIPRTTEKHPDYPKIKARLVEVLRQTGIYNPVYDDLLVGEIAKTIIDIRKVDEEIDGAENIAELQKAVRVKATLLAMLENLAEALAVTRRSRLKRGESEVFRDTMLSRLKSLIEEEA